MRLSTYEKLPFVEAKGQIVSGWTDLIEKICEYAGRVSCVCIDAYLGVYCDEWISRLVSAGLNVIDTRTFFKEESYVRSMTERYMTDDVLFGYMSPLRLEDFIDWDRVKEFRERNDNVILFGTGACAICPAAQVKIFVDMARWEIQQRFRRHEVNGLGVNNSLDPVSIQYKRGYFIDWKICDRYKESLFDRIQWWIDGNNNETPKMIDAEAFADGLARASKSPFRVVPFFDPAPWGGQWMKDVCDLDKDMVNFGWCFDCVPEENSLLLKVDGQLFEMPSVNLVLKHSRELLGEKVEARFGKDFPIRFDFLDTMGGGNLSLQVHPTTQYIHETFGVHYTQDESYYMLDAGDSAHVYLGRKTGVDMDDFISALESAQRGEGDFDAEKYINVVPAKKHDHFLIPGGTLHCSGAEGMVLEISATPNIFTFKLWDWGRLGLDGKPRPINIGRGSKVIAWERDTDYVYANLVNQVVPVSSGEGWEEEKTGLHPNEFIETRRHWFTGAVPHETFDSVNVLNLVEGEECIVESPNGEFEPFVVHYAETFIIPASVQKYTIRPYGRSEGKRCGTIKAFVRANA